MNTIFSAHISSFKMIYKPSNSLPFEFSKDICIRSKNSAEAKICESDFRPRFPSRFPYRYIYLNSIVKYLKVHLFWSSKSLFSYVTKACDFRNACCYEHAESLLYGVIWPVDTVSGPQRPVGYSIRMF